MEDDGLSFKAVSPALGLEPCPPASRQTGRAEEGAFPSPHCRWPAEPWQIRILQSLSLRSGQGPHSVHCPRELNKRLMLMEGVALNTSEGLLRRGRIVIRLHLSGCVRVTSPKAHTRPL